MKRNMIMKDYIEKYLRYVHCWSMVVYNSRERLHHWEPAPFSKYSDITKATLYNYEDAHYIVNNGYSATDIQVAVSNDIFPAIKKGDAKAMFVYSVILVGNEHCATSYLKNIEAFNYLMQSIKCGCIEATAYWGKLLWASSKYDEKWIQQQLNEFGDFAVYAMSFLAKSAKRGHIESYYWLGHCFLEMPTPTGNGPTGHTIKDMTLKARTEIALKLFQKASSLGCYNATVRLANWLSGAEEEIWRGGLLISRPSFYPYDDEQALQLYSSAVAMCETQDELLGLVRKASERMKSRILTLGYEKGLCIIDLK